MKDVKNILCENFDIKNLVEINGIFGIKITRIEKKNIFRVTVSVVPELSSLNDGGSHNLCLMKNEILSINMYVVLSGFLWMIMFIITLQVRYMLGLYGRRLNLCMPQSMGTTNYFVEFYSKFEVQGRHFLVRSLE
ncbi:hypothetical protein CR513_48898, partial [Mucuna pruriens]